MSKNLPDFLHVCSDVALDENDVKLFHYLQELITTFNHAQENTDITETPNVTSCMYSMKEFLENCRVNAYKGEKKNIFDLIQGNKFLGDEAYNIIESIIENNKENPQKVSGMLNNYQADRNAFLDHCAATKSRLVEEKVE